MLIRKAKKSDLKKINEIYIKGVVDEVKLQFPNKSKSSILEEMKKFELERLKGWKKEIDLRNNYWLVADFNGNVVGFANAEIYKDRNGRLNMLYVERGLRGKGIGKSLTLERLKWLKKQKAKYVDAGMFLKNRASINNLKKLGFKPVAVR